MERADRTHDATAAWVYAFYEIFYQKIGAFFSMKKIWGYLTAYWRSTDRWLILMWGLASALSVLFLEGIFRSGLTSTSRSVEMQIIASSVGMVAAIIISLIDYHILLKLWKLYLPACLLLVALTFFFGDLQGDNQAWLLIKIAGREFSMQPSEFLKISFITTFAMHLNHVKEHLNRLVNVLLLCLHGGLHMLIIQLQGDSGTALVYLFIFVFMFFFAGIDWKYVAVAVASLAVAVPVLWTKIMTLDQQMRFLVLLDPSLSDRYSYQQMRGLMAMGVGGVQGTGIFAEKHVYVPKMYNDFIFSFIGESAGFIGSLGVILLLAAICYKILFNSRIAIHDTGRLICVGMFAMIAGQSIINLGMCLRLLPVIGITLPLFSAGGSSVLSLYAGLGLVLSVYRHSDEGLFSSERSS